ncbi:MAG: hypothetical protein HKO59_03230 [Phycisphaerales bacterium]|nr:hypothetical protein [Phycisphaerae bacterium]NNF41800.1 hypothetical protein [Phycisphaerales bacterium]NNM24994.1 hypothetical protein [Phycisphaerales bacterium]
MPIGVAVLTLALGFGGGRGARAQIPPVLTEPLTEVDPAESLEAGVADVDPLARGLRLLQRDLQTPSGFDRVFRVPTRDDLLMRVNGGLYAVFPQSVYAQTRVGPIPVVPDNTIFYIGAESLPVTPSALRSITASAATRLINPKLDLKEERREQVLTADGQSPLATPQPVMTRAPLASAAAGVEPPAATPSPVRAGVIMSDTHYRAVRLKTLMRRAARAALADQADQAARGPSSSPSK